MSTPNTSIFVVSKMDQQTGNYENFLVFTMPKWKETKKYLSGRNWILRIEEFWLGKVVAVKTHHSLEEFENAINI